DGQQTLGTLPASRHVIDLTVNGNGDVIYSWQMANSYGPAGTAGIAVLGGADLFTEPAGTNNQVQALPDAVKAVTGGDVVFDDAPLGGGQSTVRRLHTGTTQTVSTVPSPRRLTDLTVNANGDVLYSWQVADNYGNATA